MKTNLMLSFILVLTCGMVVSISATLLYRCLQILYKREDKEKRKEPDISEKIDTISKRLSRSSIELSSLQMELERKIQFVNDLNTKANQAQNLLSLSHDQIEAIKDMLNQETQKENRANFWKNVLVNLIFFILGAIVSYFISR